VRVLPHRLSSVIFTPGRTGSGGASEHERTRSVDSSKLDVELADVQNTSMARAKSPSPPPPTMFDGQQVDSGV
jgi:hypothetical protein